MLFGLVPGVASLGYFVGKGCVQNRHDLDVTNFRDVGVEMQGEQITHCSLGLI